MCITDFVRDLFEGDIICDPCHANDPRETVKARVTYDGVERDGLTIAWWPYTFCNPPFGKLKLWLAKAAKEALGGNQIVVLCPVRSRSRWWRAARNQALTNGAYVELDRVTFVGYTNTFPESLCLMVFNTPARAVRELLEKHQIGEIALETYNP